MGCACICLLEAARLQGIRKVPTRLRIQISRRRNDDEDAQVSRPRQLLEHSPIELKVQQCRPQQLAISTVAGVAGSASSSLVIRAQSAGGVLTEYAERRVMLIACSHHSSPRYSSLQFGKSVVRGRR